MADWMRPADARDPEELELELEEALASIGRGALLLYRMLRASGEETPVLALLRALSSLAPRNGGVN